MAELKGYIEDLEELTGSIEGGVTVVNINNVISGGYKLNAVNIQTKTLSDLKNTSTAVYDSELHKVTVTGNAEGGTGSYSYKVYVEGDGYTTGGQLMASGGGISAVVQLQSGFYRLWITVTDGEGSTATQNFVLEY